MTDNDPHLPQAAAIEAYGKGGFRFAGMSHRGSILCLPAGIWAWPVTAPAEINEETLAYSAHQEVGQGGHFLGAAHTLERFRECFYRPLVSSTENYERWNRNGGRDTATRASDIWKKTLEEYEEPPMDEALKEELKAYVDRRRTELGD